MSKQLTSDEPLFINTQTTSVTIHDEQRHRIDVQPFFLLRSHPDGRFIVQGAFYEQFLAPRGPLSRFLASQYSDDIVEGVQKLVDAENLRTERERNLAQGGFNPTTGVSAAHAPPPAMMDMPDLVIDSHTNELLHKAAPNATREERNAFALYVLKKRAGYPIALTPSLAHWQETLDAIADVDPAKEGQPDDPIAHPEILQQQTEDSTLPVANPELEAHGTSGEVLNRPATAPEDNTSPAVLEGDAAAAAEDPKAAKKPKPKGK